MDTNNIFGGRLDDLEAKFAAAEEAGDLEPIPRGDYIATITKGELIESSNKGTPGYQLEFTISEGEHAGRKIWHGIWLTERALSMSKRDLRKIGVAAIRDLDRPFPAGTMKCRIKVGVRKDENGESRNSLRTFEVIGKVEPPRDAFDVEVGSDD